MLSDDLNRATNGQKNLFIITERTKEGSPEDYFEDISNKKKNSYDDPTEEARVDAKLKGLEYRFVGRELFIFKRYLFGWRAVNIRGKTVMFRINKSNLERDLIHEFS